MPAGGAGQQLGGGLPVLGAAGLLDGGEQLRVGAREADVQALGGDEAVAVRRVEGRARAPERVLLCAPTAHRGHDEDAADDDEGEQDRQKLHVLSRFEWLR
ncbi:hypothetical protein GCM10020221_09470 [Streptomyces thioluteus]|uniref:Uncharacterized protein n=1 Tax=Streptomyces thioluteus TaxID=66431 RepID=A0ABN3WHJ7_STRTU